MARILTGIQATGTPHLGNILGAIRPAIEQANGPANESFLFIADMHSLTQIKDARALRQNTYAVAAAWLAFGLDTSRSVFYRQSDVPAAAELAWYLNCFFPMSRLELAHSFKDKSAQLKESPNATPINAGLFTYPMLMSADILLYDAEFVPVGKDQKQHLEFTRDVANRLHNAMNAEVFVLPEAVIQDSVMLVPGLDGNKMSKSRNNTLNIFDDPKSLKKTINKEIETDATALEDSKNPEANSIHHLYRLIAGETAAKKMEDSLRAGGYGWGHAKKDLLEAVVDGFASEREEFNRWMADTESLENELQIGARRASAVASEVLNRVRVALGFGAI
jgi:tryptophanyl-tRNA synthetase